MKTNPILSITFLAFAALAAIIHPAMLLAASPERGFISKAPAAKWEEALVSGNGIHGAMVLAAQDAVPFAFRAVGLSNSWLKDIGNPNGFRYLRVIKTAPGLLNFSEFEVHGYPATENPAALSWDSSATGQRTDGPGNWLAPGKWWDGASNQGWTSADLMTWPLDAGATRAPGTTAGSGVQAVLVTLAAALASAPQLFVRVRVGSAAA